MLTILATIAMLLRLTSGVPVPLPPDISSRAPCRDRLRQVMVEIRSGGDIISTPHYVPECDITGRKWKQAQCDHHDVGYCFCVNPDTGAPVSGPKSHYHAKETLSCAPTEVPTGEVKFCQLRQAEYSTFRKTWPGAVGNILSYNPDCELDGKFKAMQRDSDYFFCVDVITGERIPETDTPHNTDRPLVEFVCQEYSNEWRNYMQWLRKNTLKTVTHKKHEEIANQTSCKEGFIFKECGCALKCDPGANMTQREAETECDSCQPVCACPAGSYEYNDECILNEKCMAMAPPEHKMVDIKGAVWREYRADNPNPNILAYLEQHLGVYSETGNNIGYGVDQSQESLPPPPEQDLVEDVPEEEENTYTTTESIEVPPVEGSTYGYEIEEQETEGNMEEEEEGATEIPATEEETTTEAAEQEGNDEEPTAEYYTYEYGEDYNEITEKPEEQTTSKVLELWRQLLEGTSSEQQGMRGLRQQIDGVQVQLQEIQDLLDSVLRGEDGTETVTTAQPEELPTVVDPEIQAELENISSPLKKSGVPQAPPSTE